MIRSSYHGAVQDLMNDMFVMNHELMTTFFFSHDTVNMIPYILNSANWAFIYVQFFGVDFI